MKPKNLAEASDKATEQWARQLFEGMGCGEKMYIPPQVRRVFTFRGTERETLMQGGCFLRAAGLVHGPELNYWRKPRGMKAKTIKRLKNRICRLSGGFRILDRSQSKCYCEDTESFGQ